MTDWWNDKPLAELDARQWEALCDGCARCCLHKLEDEDDGEVFYTRVRCRYLDEKTCRCSDYPNRSVLVENCIRLDASSVGSLDWLPATCAYRLIAEGKDLYWWHHLVSGSPETVHQAGISIRHRTISEDDIDEEDLPDRITQWGGEG